MSRITKITSSPAGDLLACGDDDGDIWVGRISDLSEMVTRDAHWGEIYNIVFKSDNSGLFTLAKFNPVREWSLPNLEMINQVSEGENLGIINSMDLSPDNQFLAVGSLIWRLPEGNPVATLGGIAGPSDLEFSPDGHWLVHAVSNGAKIRSVPYGEQSLILETEGRVNKFTFSPDGSILATYTRKGEVDLWYLSNGNRFNTLQGQFGLVSDMVFSPDGDYLVVIGTGSDVEIWDTSNWTLYNKIPFPGGGANLAFSPDGENIFAAGNSLWYWNIHEGIISQFDGDGSDVTYSQIAFSPFGDFFATGVMNGEIHLREATTGNLINILAGHTLPVKGLQFSSDGSFLVSASIDDSVRFWGIP
jgi:WD40 repeat protein